MKQSDIEIMLVEDDRNLGFVIKDSLELQGYQVDLYTDGQAALAAFSSRNYHIYLLDVMLPALDGFGLARKIRTIDQHTPILFLTAKSQKEDRIEGFRIGGDDYIPKPFHVDELILRIEVFLKRSLGNHSSQQDIYQIGDVILNAKQYTLTCKQLTTHLTDKETQLLTLLIEHKGQVVRREDILKKIWGDDDYFMGRSLDVFISRLRKHLKSCPEITIKNLHGIGFCMLENDNG